MILLRKYHRKHSCFSDFLSCSARVLMDIRTSYLSEVHVKILHACDMCIERAGGAEEEDDGQVER